MAEVELRRLDPDQDEPLIREAVRWLDSAPRWFREFEAEFGAPTYKQLREEMRQPNQIDYGVFERGGLTGLLTVVLHGGGLCETHFRIKGAGGIHALVVAAQGLRDEIFRRTGTLEIFGFIPRFNRGAIRFAEVAGLLKDGIRETAGRVRGRPVEWVRLSISRARWEREYGQEEDNAEHDAEPELQQPEHLLVDAAARHGRHPGTPRL